MAILVITTTVPDVPGVRLTVVLPIKAALMSALTVGSDTMGIPTWMFARAQARVRADESTPPQLLMAPMIGLIIARSSGVCPPDYEVFLVSLHGGGLRARARPPPRPSGSVPPPPAASSPVPPAGSRAGRLRLSDSVVMKCPTFGLPIALLPDATVIRMFLVPPS